MFDVTHNKRTDTWSWNLFGADGKTLICQQSPWNSSKSKEACIEDIEKVAEVFEQFQRNGKLPIRCAEIEWEDCSIELTTQNVIIEQNEPDQD